MHSGPFIPVHKGDAYHKLKMVCIFLPVCYASWSVNTVNFWILIKLC